MLTLQTKHREVTVCRPSLERLASKADLDGLGVLAEIVDSLYPSGAEKLEARCLDAFDGLARGHVVRDPWGYVAAFAMETPKGLNRIKLSTIWVSETHRRLGIGTALVSRLSMDWLDRGIESVHVTARAGLHTELLSAFKPLGFEMVGLERNRYGAGRDEAVLQWTPERSVSETWNQFLSARLQIL